MLEKPMTQEEWLELLQLVGLANAKIKDLLAMEERAQDFLALIDEFDVPSERERELVRGIVRMILTGVSPLQTGGDPASN